MARPEARAPCDGSHDDDELVVAHSGRHEDEAPAEVTSGNMRGRHGGGKRGERLRFHNVVDLIWPRWRRGGALCILLLQQVER